MSGVPGLKGEPCTFRRMVRDPEVVVLLAVIAIFSGGCGSSAHQQGAAPPSPASGTKPSLIFSTYLGGATACTSCPAARTFAQNAASDTQGNTYVTGGTEVSDLPVLNAYQSSPAANSQMSAFVAKYGPAGNLLWLTYLGGDQQSMGVGVAVMPDGGVAVAGLTSSDSVGPFPTKNAFQNANSGQSDYFVTVFDASGSVRYSTYLGGSRVEGPLNSVFTDNNSNGNNIAADTKGLVYVTGVTASINLPLSPNALQTALKGTSNAFLAIFDPGQSGAGSLIYSSYLGGSGSEKGHSVAVNSAGTYIAVAGYTNSPDFPTTANGYQPDAPSSFTSNGFVTQFTSSQPGSSSSNYTMRYSTYLGANTSGARDDTYGMTMDSNGFILATGRTQSAAFPMAGASIYNSATYLAPDTSGDEPYLVKLNPSLSGAASLVYSTFLGGGEATGGSTAWSSFCTSIGVDSSGAAYVGGETTAPGVEYAYSASPMAAPNDFPYTQNALYTSNQGTYDAIFMQISPGGGKLEYSTFLGGSGNDRTYGLALDGAGNVVLTGVTSSSDFRTKNPAQPWPGSNSQQNAFVTKFSLN